jgi:uncharacterized protein (TIGR00369 family)
VTGERRTGTRGFWERMEGRAPMPPAAAALGLELIDVDPERGTIELAFAAREEFTNPAGDVLGAFLAAMLYDTDGPALLATVQPDEFQSTSDLSVRFLRPARPGRLIGRGRIADRSGELVRLKAELSDEEGETLATAVASARVIPLERAAEAA